VTFAKPRDWRRIALVVLAAIVGAARDHRRVVLAEPGDNYAYWLAAERLVAGEPVYVTGEAAFAPYAYHYTPPLAQVLAPLTLVLPAIAYIVGYRSWRSCRSGTSRGEPCSPCLPSSRSCRSPVELRFENVHILMAVAIVLGLSRCRCYSRSRRSSRSARPRRRVPGPSATLSRCVVTLLVGAAICAVSYALSPSLWRSSCPRSATEPASPATAWSGAVCGPGDRGPCPRGGRRDHRSAARRAVAGPGDHRGEPESRPERLRGPRGGRPGVACGTRRVARGKDRRAEVAASV
jgi:hypothetical protein